MSLDPQNNPPTPECWEPLSDSLQHKHIIPCYGHHSQTMKSEVPELSPPFQSHPKPLYMFPGNCIFFYVLFIFTLCVGILSVCVCTCSRLVSAEPGEGTGYLRPGVTHGSKPRCGCWVSSLGPLQEPVLSLKKKKKERKCGSLHHAFYLAVKKSGIMTFAGK